MLGFDVVSQPPHHKKRFWTKLALVFFCVSMRNLDVSVVGAAVFENFAAMTRKKFLLT